MLTRERREIDNRYKSDQKTGKKLRAIENFEECRFNWKILFTGSDFFAFIDPNLASEAAQPLQLGEKEASTSGFTSPCSPPPQGSSS
jgi:hypothetical protein